MERLNNLTDLGAPAQTVQDEWRPIDTAPKDGSVLLLYVPNRCMIDMGSWRNDDNYPDEPKQWFDNSYDDYSCGYASCPLTPTHWQPLPAPPARPKLLIIGHGRHGKDAFAEILRDEHGYKFTSSSEFVGEECIWDNWGCAKYDSFEAMYADRAQHRQVWFELIAAYNTPDKTKTAATMLQRGFDLYVGMRKRDELDACNEAGLFDAVVWIDRSLHCPNEPADSMELTAEDAHIVVDNNGSLDDLRQAAKDVLAHLRKHGA